MAKNSSGKKYYFLTHRLTGYWKDKSVRLFEGGLYQRSKNAMICLDDDKDMWCKCSDRDVATYFGELDQDDYELLRAIASKTDRLYTNYTGPLYRDIKDAKIGDGVSVTNKEWKKSCIEVNYCLRDGEIRYMGPLPGREGRYFGIQLEEPFGYSDGTINGDSFFECLQSHGIFVTANDIKSVFQKDQEGPPEHHGSTLPHECSPMQPSAPPKEPTPPPLENPETLLSSNNATPASTTDTALKTNNDLTKNFTSHFSCPLCLDIVEEAVEADCCRKLFCEKCVKSLRECPLCRSCPFKTSPNHNARQFIGNLIIECPNESCPETPTRSNLADHRQKCEYEEVGCLNDGCDARVVRKNASKHKSACGFGMVRCFSRGCNFTFPRNQSDYHDTVCQFTIVPCPNSECPERRIHRKHFNKHVHKECKFERVQCPASRCNFNDTRLAVGHHIVDVHFKDFAENMHMLFPACDDDFPSVPGVFTPGN